MRSLLVYTACSFSAIFLMNLVLYNRSDDTRNYPRPIWSSPLNFTSEEVISDEVVVTPISEKIDVDQQPKIVPLAPCPSGPIVTTKDDGRLGNKMWEYSSVWTLAKQLGRPAYVPHSLLSYLNETFVGLSLPDLDDISHCNLKLNYDKPATADDVNTKEKANKKFKGQHILLKKDIELPNLVMASLKSLENEFVFHPYILKEVEETVIKVGGKGRIRVGVHVRRTDYEKLLKKWYKTSYTSKDFYLLAMQRMRQKLKGNLIFLIVSDDAEWCRDNLLDHSDVVLASKSASHDMALLATSNHTIIDYGTFGQWGAMLAALKGGHTIVYNAAKHSNGLMAKFLKNVHFYDPQKKRLTS